MSLTQVAHFNDFSDGLRKKLEERISSFGKMVRYKFDLAKPNPDPQKYNGDIIYPGSYTLDPTIFQITDNDENRTGKSKTKTVALIASINQEGKPEKFIKIRVLDKQRGDLILFVGDNTKPEDKELAMYLEMHPKNKNGMFPDPSKHQVFQRIEETVNAAEERKVRSERKKAMDAAENMTYEELKEFANAMLWDSTEEEIILRNKVEELAEKEPDYFNDIVASKKTKYLSLIKKAMDARAIQYDPVDGKLSYASTGQPIVILGADAGSEGWGRYAEWFMTAGKKADDVYKKLTAMLNPVPAENS